ncbi:MAG TPA: hypothetical protein VFR37_25310, partial [Longimicrobium sp.]|nr:hypothetical protein [Longimicrobium sp.]
MPEQTQTASAPPAVAASLQAAKKAVEAATPKDFLVNKTIMVDRNFWQNRQGWGGPPVPAGHPDADALWKRIEDLFTPRDAVGEAAKNRTDAILKFEPQVGMSLRRAVTEAEPESDDESALRADAEAAVTPWWDSAGVQRQARIAAHATTWAGDNDEGWAFLRWWVPAHFLTEGVDGAMRLEATDVADALRKISVSAVLPDAAARVVDTATGKEAFVLLDGTGKDQVAEIYYLDGEDTVLVSIGKRTRTEVRLQIGGRLPMVMVQGRKIIDAAVRKQQRMLNFFNTSVGRIVETCAWPQTY